MGREITPRELRDETAEVMGGLDRAEALAVARAGVPVGELTQAGRRFVSADTVVAIFRGAPAIDRHAFRRDLDRT